MTNANVCYNANMADVIAAKKVSTYRKFDLKKGAKIYTELRNEVASKGLLDRSYGFYALLIFLTYAGLVGTFVATYFAGNIFVFVALCFLYGFFSVQIGGLVHDAGHREIFKSARNNDIVGHFLATTVGFAFHNWRVNHDRHHANPNQDGFDPDVEVPFSFTPERIKKSKGLAKLICKYQAWAYYPLGTLTSFSVRFKKFNYFTENWGPKVYPDLLFFVVGVALHISLPFFAFGLVKGFAFFMITNLVGGFYLFNIFAPNHKGMPELERDAKFSFFEQQIITARNVVASPWHDYVYLGLNYQIEHHLFPTAPRNKLHRIAPIVKKYCKKYGLEYAETGAIESNIIIFNEMRAMSKALLG